MKVKFYCDIEGTFTGKKDRQKNLEDFLTLLSLLGDEISFSFVSSDAEEEVIEYSDELQNTINNMQLNSAIKIGDNYTGDTKIKGKPFQIIHDLSKNNYDKVYYADDIDSNLIMTSALFAKQIENSSLICFNPTKSTSQELKGLNELLNTYIEEKSKSL